MAKLDIAVSEEMAKLSVRAKEAETRAKAARDETKADLERDAAAARASSQAQAEKLREKANASKGKISAGWAHMQQAWSEHIAKIRADIESKKAKHDPGREEGRARRTRRIVRDRIRVWGNRGGRVCGARRGPCEDGCRRAGGSASISRVRRHRRPPGRCRAAERLPWQPVHHQYPDGQGRPLLVGGVAARRALVGHRGGRAEVQPRVGRPRSAC